jgi:hypothetical protein
LVVSYDTHDGTDLHPKEKIPIGERCAQLARAMAYGEDVVAEGPKFKTLAIEGSAAVATFDVPGGRLKTRGGESVVRGFMLAGPDEQYRYAQGVLEGADQVRLTADNVSEPKTVRFAWEGVPQANLINEAGLPAEPFRTDQFPAQDVAYVKIPASRKVQSASYEAVVDYRGGLASLAIAGEQFVSNDPEMGGGSCVPTFFGPRGLSQVTEIGPDSITFADQEISLNYDFRADRVTMQLENRSKGECPFQIAVAAGVEAIERDAIELSRRKATLTVEGFSKVERSPSGKVLLKVAVPSGATKTMTLKPAR